MSKSKFIYPDGKRTSRLFMHDDWVPNHHYHIIGKAVPGRLLFKEEIHYRRFLRKSVRDLYQMVFQIYVYCLLPNHFHLAIRTLTEEEMRERLAPLKRELRPFQRAFLEGRLDWRAYVIATFGAATNSHAQYINHALGLKGQLFVKPTLHGLTDKGEPGKEYSRRMAAYIAFNYYKHGLMPAEGQYPWSSLRKPMYYIIEPEIVKHYGSEEEYITYHLNYLKKYGAHMLDFDEEAFFSNLTPRRYIADYGEWQAEQEKK
ncbi:MAG: hypothetical protein AB8F78_15200 [Saprospiraceae bacterium]